MEDNKQTILSLFKEAQPLLERCGNADAAPDGFEECAGEEALERVFEIGDRVAQIPSASEDDKRCKARIFRAIASEPSSVVDAPSPEERLLWSIIEDLDPDKD